jgi:hypothetical protein
MKDGMHTLTLMVKKYPHRFSTAFFILGFLWDALTLWKADGWYENTWFGVYLIVSTVIIVALFHTDEKKEYQHRGLLIAALQFCFGALAGGMLVLYGRSGTFAGSATFLSVGAAILLSNDLFSHRYSAQTMRIGVWYSLLLAYISMVLPILYGRIGGDVFVHGILTGCIIAFVMIVCFRLVGYLARPRDLYAPLTIVTLVTVFFLFSHFTRIMPAVPLALRHAGIAHAVEHIGTQYTIAYEESRVPFFLETAHTFRAQLPARLYCFGQVYVPRTITTGIQHHWEVYSPTKGEWITITTIPFQVTGGREEGYRGYTYVTARSEGEYRCSIETDAGVLIGRRSVKVERGVPVIKTMLF